MAKNTVKFSCGHTDTVDLFGPMADRSKTIARLESDACPACRAAAAKTQAAATGLPALVGSDKQIAWASDIRTAVLADKAVLQYRDQLPAMRAQAATVPAAAPVLAAIEAALAKLDGETSAKWWIDNQTSAARSVMAAHRAAAKAAAL